MLNPVTNDRPRHEPHAATTTVWQALATVTDPEIPVLNIVEMGLVREVSFEGAGVHVVITPTFSGCPALRVIEENVASAVRAAGFPHVEVASRLSPPWSTDDMTDDARSKLEEFGIAPPQPHGGLIQIALDAPVRCPRCGHPDTRLRNPFGSALCREIRTCQGCQETFERFKPL
ncbi:MAG: 1,2-phenylacetyl-CoA epoxidase subunit PaaD [Trueperaceae bacterium]